MHAVVYVPPSPAIMDRFSWLKLCTTSSRRRSARQGVLPGGQAQALASSSKGCHWGMRADQVTQSSPGPTGGRFVEGGDIRDEADPAGIKWGEKPKRPEGPTEHVG